MRRPHNRPRFMLRRAKCLARHACPLRKTLPNRHQWPGLCEQISAAIAASILLWIVRAGAMAQAEDVTALGLSPHALRIWRDRLEQSDTKRIGDRCFTRRNSRCLARTRTVSEKPTISHRRKRIGVSCVTKLHNWAGAGSSRHPAEFPPTRGVQLLGEWRYCTLTALLLRSCDIIGANGYPAGARIEDILCAAPSRPQGVAPRAGARIETRLYGPPQATCYAQIGIRGLLYISLWA